MKADLNIFPNPAHDVIRVTASADIVNAIITITDAAGKRKLSTTLVNGQLNIAGLKTGVYTISIATKKNALVQKFTKK